MEVDVSTDEAAREIVLRTRQCSVPVTDLSGTLVVGFDVRRWEKVLHPP